MLTYFKMNPESLLRDLAQVNQALGRARETVKSLTETKKRLEANIYVYLRDHQMNEINGIKVEKVAPKKRPPRKKLAAKKADAIRLFEATGIPEPASFWEEFQATQKLIQDEA
jgi:hypothetical protein